jgi:WD repeat-containing protein 76
MARTAVAPISDYERKRQEQIAKNQALLRDLALDAASAGLAPSKARSAAPAKSQKKKPAPKKVEDIAPRRTSSRLRGIVADSEVAKRKAEEEHEAFREQERLKRQRVSGDLSLTDVGVNGKEWNLSGNFLRNTGPAAPGVRTFKVEDFKESSDKELKALRERMSGLQLWEEFTPNGTYETAAQCQNWNWLTIR